MSRRPPILTKLLLCASRCCTAPAAATAVATTSAAAVTHGAAMHGPSRHGAIPHGAGSRGATATAAAASKHGRQAQEAQHRTGSAASETHDTERRPGKQPRCSAGATPRQADARHHKPCKAFKDAFVPAERICSGHGKPAWMNSMQATICFEIGNRCSCAVHRQL